jgi:hypothetical protein
MSSATQVLGKVRISRSSNRASNNVTWDAEKERRTVAGVVACVVPEVAEPGHEAPVSLVHRENSVLPFRRPSVSLDLEDFQ